MVNSSITARPPLALPFSGSLVRGIGATAWRYAPLPLRVMLGVGFMIHGWPKLFGNHAQFSSMLAAKGVPVPELMAWFVGGLEVFGGFALLIGAFVGMFSLLFIIEMIVAIFLVHIGQGFEGSEKPLLYIAGVASLFMMGAGALSLDDTLAKKRVGETPRTDLR